MITKKLTKLLTISVIGLSIINGSYTEAASEGCLRVCQFVGSIGVGLGQSRIKGELNKQDVQKKLKAAKLLNDKNQFVGLAPSSTKQMQYKLTNGDSTQAEPINFVVRNDINDIDQNNIFNDWNGRPSNANSQLTLEPFELKTDADGKQYIEFSAKQTFNGDVGQVLPIVSSQNGAHLDQGGHVNMPGANITDITKTTSATQKIFIDVDSSKFPKYGFDNEDGYNLIQQFNEKNVWPGSSKEVQGYAEANLGLKFNLSHGSIIAAVFGEKVFWNSTQKFTFGQENDGSNDKKTDEDNTNNSTNNDNWSYDIKEKGKLGFSFSVSVPLTDKVGCRLGIGGQWGWYDSSASSNDNNNDSNSNTNTNKTYLLKQKQSMRGFAPFFEGGILYNFNKNFGVEIFGRYTAPCDLKEIDAKSNTDSNDNNTNSDNGISQSYTIKGAVSGGIRFVFMF